VGRASRDWGEARPLLEGLLREGHAITIPPIIKAGAEVEMVSPLYLDMVEDAVIVAPKSSIEEDLDSVEKVGEVSRGS